MMAIHDPISILMVDDDPDDRLLVADAFEANRMTGRLRFAEDGQGLMDYLNQRGRYHDPDRFPRPDLILLDLNMPGMDGREALAEIKNDPRFRAIPIVVLTTSSQESDIRQTYDLGANSYIVKPMRFSDLVQAIGSLGSYWFEMVKLPQRAAGHPARH